MKTDRYAALLRRVEKPGRYTGGEFGEVYKENMPVRMCFCFPDTYEIGMSNLGMKILTGALNRLDFLGCERCFAPWADMEAELRKTGTKLFALESGDPLDAFDVVAFTMQYELCYTNVVNMLRLAGIPPLARDRGEDAPLILGGGRGCGAVPDLHRRGGFPVLPHGNGFAFGLYGFRLDGRNLRRRTGAVRSPERRHRRVRQLLRYAACEQAGPQLRALLQQRVL